MPFRGAPDGSRDARLCGPAATQQCPEVDDRRQTDVSAASTRRPGHMRRAVLGSSSSLLLRVRRRQPRRLRRRHGGRRRGAVDDAGRARRSHRRPRLPAAPLGVPLVLARRRQPRSTWKHAAPRGDKGDAKRKTAQAEVEFAFATASSTPSWARCTRPSRAAPARPHAQRCRSAAQESECRRCRSTARAAACEAPTPTTRCSSAAWCAARSVRTPPAGPS